MSADVRRRNAQLRKEEITQKVLEVLSENRKGLTARQIAIKVGGRLPRMLLAELRKDGVLKQKKGISMDGRISIIYVLNDRKKVRR